MIDNFEDREYFYSVKKIVTAKTLASMIPHAYKDGFDVDFAKTTIATLCNIID